MKSKYDYLIVGAGLFGATFAYEMTRRNKKCLVIDKRSHVGGNVYTKSVHGINVHVYGAHIFHTSDETVWKFVNGFARFNGFVNSPIADFNGERYPLPFNMNTFRKLWKDVKTEADARAKIASQTMGYHPETAKNLKEKAISFVGREIYEKLIEGYTEKQWGRPCEELPPFIIERVPLRFTYDNNYFNDAYQGVPVGGYTAMIENMLVGSDVLLGTPYKKFVNKYGSVSNAVIYTGAIDEYFDYRLGKLDFRTLKFETVAMDVADFQGNAVVNYTSKKVPYTRVIEHKHFENARTNVTVVTKEYPAEYSDGCEKFYPVNDEKNERLYAEYAELAKTVKKVYFCGRLGSYKYFDMDDTVKNAADLAEELESN